MVVHGTQAARSMQEVGGGATQGCVLVTSRCGLGREVADDEGVYVLGDDD